MISCPLDSRAETVAITSPRLTAVTVPESWLRMLKPMEGNGKRDPSPHQSGVTAASRTVKTLSKAGMRVDDPSRPVSAGGKPQDPLPCGGSAPTPPTGGKPPDPLDAEAKHGDGRVHATA
ncbi:hypothetical protein Atai01_44270 [Amycolatopsis taiwanensis]|uniref:Uncharacterized protein n=1 Tax=Amycolatopsis taiwanensis TaxID=342230 RepID=A0A9W6VDW9_9PSEU|nr:hypothetical protein Atai01_44270 [Amycolatopsis taiwanensis]